MSAKYQQQQARPSSALWTSWHWLLRAVAGLQGSSDFAPKQCQTSSRIAGGLGIKQALAHSVDKDKPGFGVDYIILSMYSTLMTGRQVAQDEQVPVRNLYSWRRLLFLRAANNGDPPWHLPAFPSLCPCSLFSTSRVGTQVFKGC